MLTATIFTVSWNWRNLEMHSYTLRPHSAAVTICAKLSSRRTYSAWEGVGMHGHELMRWARISASFSTQAGKQART